MFKLTNTRLKEINKLRSKFLQFTNKEVSEYLKSNILINSISIQKYVNQFTSQVIEIKSQSFSSNNASTPNHFTNKILKIPCMCLEDKLITKSPKKTIIGKEKLLWFQKQINNTSPSHLSINSLRSSSNDNQLNKSFESVMSVQSNHNEIKSRKKEGRSYLMNLSLAFKLRKSKLKERGSVFHSKNPQLCYINYNPLLFKTNSGSKKDSDDINVSPPQIISEGNSMFTITLNSCND